MKANTQSQSDQVKKNTSSPKFNSTYFFIGFITVSFVAAFIIGGFILGKEKTKKQDAATAVKDQVKISADELPDNPENWKAYQSSALGIEVKLPENLAKKGEWEFFEIPGEKGSIICFTSQKPEGSVCSGDIFVIGGSSSDYVEGREGMFTDFQGFSKKDDKYFIKTTGGNSFELMNATFKEFENENGSEIIKILGENTNFEGNEIPLGGTPGEGYLGAIINTKDSKYPGLSVQLKLNGDISEYEFDQILRSFKYTE